MVNLVDEERAASQGPRAVDAISRRRPASVLRPHGLQVEVAARQAGFSGLDLAQRACTPPPPSPNNNKNKTKQKNSKNQQRNVG